MEGPRGVGRCQDRVSQNILRHLEKNKLDWGKKDSFEGSILAELHPM